MRPSVRCLPLVDTHRRSAPCCLQASQSQSEASQLPACYDDVQQQQGKEEEAERHGLPGDG